MQKELFEKFIDILCQHLDNAVIKKLIENGFDDWEIVSACTLSDLIEVGMEKQQAQIILECVSRIQEMPEQDNSKEVQPEVPVPAPKIEKQSYHFEQNPMTIQLLLKGTHVKPTSKQPQDKFLQSLTMITLEERKITRISCLETLTSLQMLHVGRNNITKIEGLENLQQLKNLKLDHNYISKMQGLSTLVSLVKLTLDHNQIQRIEGLTNCHNLTELSISDQKIDVSMTFEPQSMETIGHGLQIFICNGNKVSDISEIRKLRFLSTLEMRSNNLKDVNSIAQVLGSLGRIKTVTFLGCPLVKAPKYRDYSVILSKSLQQLDGKKILPTERQYLVKLYSLKHAKQKKEEEEQHKLPNKPKGNPQINVQRISEQGQLQTAVQRLNSATDFHNNLAYVSSKRQPTKKN